MYDLSKDPHELNNVATDPKREKLKSRLKSRLEKWMVSQGDMGMATELAARKNKK